MKLAGNRNITNFADLNREIGILYRQMSKISTGGNTTTIVTGGSGGGSTTSIEVPYRSGQQILPAGKTNITFAKDIGTSIYNLWLRGYDSSGYDIGLSINDITNKSSTGFDITLSQIAFLEWVAIPIK